MEKFWCSANQKKDAKVKKIAEQLEPHGGDLKK